MYHAETIHRSKNLEQWLTPREHHQQAWDHFHGPHMWAHIQSCARSWASGYRMKTSQSRLQWSFVDHQVALLCHSPVLIGLENSDLKEHKPTIHTNSNFFTQGNFIPKGWWHLYDYSTVKTQYCCRIQADLNHPEQFASRKRQGGGKGHTDELLEHVLEHILKSRFQSFIAVVGSKIYFPPNWEPIHVNLHKEGSLCHLSPVTCWSCCCCCCQWNYSSGDLRSCCCCWPGLSFLGRSRPRRLLLY